MKKILVIIGSASPNSINQKVAERMIEKNKDLADFSITRVDNLPFFASVESDENVTKFLNAVKESDGVIIFAPEYNGRMTGVLKNALDWASTGERVFSYKPILVTGVTPSVLGTIRSQEDVKYVLSQPAYKCRLCFEQPVLLGQSHLKMDKEGNITDESMASFLQSSLEGFVNNFIN